ncbi:hypothetical protein [Paenibacillus larvae]|uniref:hypothetical protein n=1 Tax=Paenibacillus larvae TaxID=1464 RepID=UPI0037CA4F95
MDIHKQYELQEILRLSEHFNLIPIVRELLADTETPIRMFQHFYEDQHAFLLESVEGGVKWARYSFIGTDPFLIIRSKKASLPLKRTESIRFIRKNRLKFLNRTWMVTGAPSFHIFPVSQGGDRILRI